MLAVLGLTSFLIFLNSTIKKTPDQTIAVSTKDETPLCQENVCKTTTRDKNLSYIEVWENCILNKTQGLKYSVSENTTEIFCDPGRLYLLYISCSLKQEDNDTWEGCLSANNFFLYGGSNELTIPIPGMTELSFEKEQEEVVCLNDRGSDNVFSTCSVHKFFNYWIENVYINCPPGYVICPETQSCLIANRKQECIGK
ncbi:uncharacterized protein LOC143239473 [Tachypleus tridentatus]|uniref:uncharacterized protein LOC143239473 n=1 Tax=Tachypleus tridentatus TaxID=6853 RepID=UPI003FD39A63